MMYICLSVLVVINVILAVRGQVCSQPHLVASSGVEKKFKNLG